MVDILYSLTEVELKHEMDKAWTMIEEKVKKCQKCPLWESRTQSVFGDGAKKTELMFVGEGPGADEDTQGLPFVGRAGQLLNQIFTAAGIKDRKSVV